MRGIHVIPVIASVLILGLIPFIDAISVTEDVKLTASDAAAGDEFGWSVAISGDTAIVGAPLKDDGCPIDPLSSMIRNCSTGSVYVLVRNGSTWTEQATLTASNVLAAFGWSVSISGDTIIGGAQAEEIAGVLSGSAYVFTRSGTTWTQQAKLTASDAAAGDEFGRSVSMSGDTAIVGAFRDNDAGPDSGSAYVFTRSGTTWTQQAKLTASDAAAGDEFGRSVSISGDTIIVGANSNDSVGPDSGAAYVFTRSGTTWTQQAKLTASDASAGDFFGYSVSISGDTAIVGANLDDDAGSSSGSAYVFVRSGTTWTQQAKLTALDGATNDHFGHGVAISGDTAIVGSYWDDDAGSGSGSAYVFVRSGTTWTQQAKLTASDAAAGDFFGYSVSISGDTTIVGAPSYEVPGIGMQTVSFSGAYVFTRDTADNWMQSAKLFPSDFIEGDFFGTSVSVSGNKAMVGRSSGIGGDTFGVGIRSAYVFENLPVDTDGVGIPDVSDGCLNDPNKIDPSTTGCGNPEPPTTAIWLIPVIVAGIGIGFVIIRRRLFR